MVNKKSLSYTLVLLCLGCCGGLTLYRLFDVSTPTGVIIPTERSLVSQAAPLPGRSHTPSPASEPTSTFTPPASPTAIQPTNTPEITLTTLVTGEPDWLPAACIPEGAQIEQAGVTRVIDGDTIEVSIDGVEYRVRYIGVDSPELEFPLGPESQAANAGLVEGKQVALLRDTTDMDRYNRLLRYVIVDGLFVNYELVKSGHAMSKGYDPDTACQEMFDQAEMQAKHDALGMWAAELSLPGRLQPTGTTMSVLTIQTVFYDGIVPRVESDEYAEIINNGSEPIDLAGWRLNAGSQGQDYEFPAFTLQPGQTCRVYTNETHPEACGFSFASPDPLWNNKGDCGYLYDQSGNLVDDYCY